MNRATSTGPARGGRPSPLPADDGAPRDGADPLGPGRATLVVVLVVVAVVLTALAGPFSPTFADRGPVAAELDLPTPTPEPVLEDPFADLLEQTEPVDPVDLRWLAAALLVLVVAVVTWSLVRLALRLRLRLRGRGEPDPGDVAGAGVLGAPDVEPDLPTLREGVDDAGRHLDRHVEPQDAVIAAWVALEDAASRTGVVRDPAQTPTEFTLEVLDRTPADRTATRTLLDLYLRARFGGEPVGPADVVRAAKAVDVLARSLADGSPGDSPGRSDGTLDDDPDEREDRP